jgi:hypothetical protein
VLLLLLFKPQIGFLPPGSGTTMRHNKRTHIIQNKTPHSNKTTAYKTTQTIKCTLYTMNTMQIHLKLQVKLQQLNALILIKYKCTIH